MNVVSYKGLGFSVTTGRAIGLFDRICAVFLSCSSCSSWWENLRSNSTGTFQITALLKFEMLNLGSKESWPRGPGFDFTPEGWFWPSDNPWNNGMVESWNIGYQKRMMICFIFFVIRAIHKKQIAFRQTHYSNIPVFHHSTVNVYGTANLLWPP